MKKVHQNITNVNKEHGEHVKIYSKNIRLNTQQWLVRTRGIRKQCAILTLKKGCRALQRKSSWRNKKQEGENKEALN